MKLPILSRMTRIDGARNPGDFSWAPVMALLLAALITTVPILAEETEAEPSSSESASESSASDDLPSFFARTTVTATGSEVDTFEITTPVTVIRAEEIELKAAHNASDLLRTEPGVDVNGVGPNQARPIIRGQRGLRVLFLENGLRMNNARRQSDFGEIPGLVDLDTVAAVEIVRGPASVLYGSDAIGGVLNLVTRTPPHSDGAGLGGSLALRGSSADDQQKIHATLEGRSERAWWSTSFSYRDIPGYDAPSGSFGDVTLAADTPVIDSGVRDDTFHALAGLQLSEKHELSLRYNRYRADETGFGLVEPAALGIDDPFRIRIFYPFQNFDRFQLSYLGSALDSPWADSVDVKLYHQSNERELVNDIDNILIGPLFPGAPDSSIDIDTLNFSDLETLGLRIETVKLLGEQHLLTYGVEAYEDDSFNTDHSDTTVILRFPFPPFEIRDITTDAVANAPNATNTSYGVFVQDEIVVSDRLKVTLGARFQQVETRAEATPGWDTAGLDFDDDAVVGTATVLYSVSEELNLFASYGTAFRAPNIIERLFNGITPEGSGFQILNPDLASEESDNIDLGLKYLRSNAYLEATVFRTEIDDGIVQDFLSPAEIAALPADVRAEIGSVAFVVQQRNVQRLRYEGVEIATGYRTDGGLEFGANFTYLDAERIDTTQPPSGDTFSDKWNGFVRYRPRQSRYWLEYRLRHNGSTRPNVDPDEPLPLVGAELPSFTVHTVAGGVTLFERERQEHTLNLVVDNLTDELYAEFSNASFFRPQPGRNVTATYRVRF